MSADGILRETETEFCVMVDYLSPTGFNPPSSTRERLHYCSTEAEALEEARWRLAVLAEKGAWRAEIFAREVPVAWTKVEELRPEPSA